MGDFIVFGRFVEEIGCRPCWKSVSLTIVGVMKMIRRLSLFSDFAFASEGPTQAGDVAENRHFGILSAWVVLHQAAHDERVGIGNQDLGFDVAEVKYVSRVS